MKLSNLNLITLKNKPSDAEIVSHQLMLRSGMIKKLASGLYTWMPLGYKVLKKIEIIIAKEMDKIGCLRITMPAVQPKELWEESSRWDKYGKELLRINDRHEREFCFGPTHEEVVTDIIRRDIKSYKQLPITLYQIQTKFRDEIRPRFGVMRAREFLMKDAYSFHSTNECLNDFYKIMYESYKNILNYMRSKRSSALNFLSLFSLVCNDNEIKKLSKEINNSNLHFKNEKKDYYPILKLYRKKNQNKLIKLIKENKFSKKKRIYVYSAGLYSRIIIKLLKNKNIRISKYTNYLNFNTPLRVLITTL